MIARLLEHVHSTASNVTTMSDEELANVVRDQVNQLVHIHPELVESLVRAEVSQSVPDGEPTP